MSWKAKTASLANQFLRPFDIRISRGIDSWRPLNQLGRQPIPGPINGIHSGAPYARTFAGRSAGNPQTTFDFAIVMVSVLRPSIVDAIRSVFAQEFPGRVQILVGIDHARGDFSLLEGVCSEVPDRHAISVLYPGYSTSRRHGGLHPTWDGGALRTILAYLANSRYVAYLDDDNWWASHHLSTMHKALENNEWAYALRWYVHPGSRRPVCEDRWESIGPVAGGTEFDRIGWADPNCIAMDKLACEAVLRWWGIPLRNSLRAMDGDRNVFRILSSEFRGKGTGQHTVFYALDETDTRHASRLAKMGAERYAAAGTIEKPQRVNA